MLPSTTLIFNQRLYFNQPSSSNDDHLKFFVYNIQYLNCYYIHVLLMFERNESYLENAFAFQIRHHLQEYYNLL